MQVPKLKIASTYMYGFLPKYNIYNAPDCKRYTVFILMNKFNKIESDVFKFCRFSLFLKEPFPRLFIFNRLDTITT